MDDLCSLDDAKAYLGIPSATTTSDDVLSDLITFVSAYALNQANVSDREDGEDPSFFEDDYTETYDGHGGQVLLLRHSSPATPVSRVRSVTVSGTPIPKSPGAPQSGFAWDRFSVRLRGYTFTKGVQNVTVSYTSGNDANGATGQMLRGAAAEWVALIFKTRAHIDVRSKTLDRETVTFMAETMPVRMAAVLTNLKNRVAA